MELKGRCQNIENINKVTGVTTFLLLDDINQKLIRVIGISPDITRNGQYQLRGQFQSDKIFYFESIRRMSDRRRESIHLLSDCIYGISEAIAEGIVDVLGENIYAYTEIENLDKKLYEIPGVGLKRAHNVKEFIYKASRQNELFHFLTKYNVPYSLSLKIIGANPSISIMDVRKFPYSLMDFGVPFDICDEIAIKEQIDPWDFGRIDAILRSVLNQMNRQGNTRMAFNDFIEAVSSYSYQKGKRLVNIPADLIRIIACATKYLKVYKEEGLEYVSSLTAYLQEKDIVKNCERVETYRKRYDGNLGKQIQMTEENIGIQYNEEQKKAFEIISEGGMGLLLGGPGTGKTTIINGLIQVFLMVYPEEKVLLCAPTGRAAARLAEISGRDAKTLHKAMGLKWYGNRNSHTNPLEYGLIIVDEMGMCDTELFSVFLKSVVSGTAVVLSGDYDQIPSVGPGQVFRDLVESKRFRICQLLKTVRQGEGSLIIQNAKRILEGEKLKTGTEFQIVVVPNDHAIYQTIQKWKVQDVPQILCPIKKTLAGTESLNILIQSMHHWEDRGVLIDGTWFHVGDKVIMNANNYPVGYMNGDVGEIREIRNSSMKIAFINKTLEIACSALSGMDLAYALTFHKSQGAECENVGIVLPESAKNMASRELLYTAVTRAKKKVWLIAAEGVLETYRTVVGRSYRECGLRSGLEGKIFYKKEWL